MVRRTRKVETMHEPLKKKLKKKKMNITNQKSVKKNGKRKRASASAKILN